MAYNINQSLIIINLFLIVGQYNRQIMNFRGLLFILFLMFSGVSQANQNLRRSILQIWIQEDQEDQTINTSLTKKWKKLRQNKNNKIIHFSNDKINRIKKNIQRFLIQKLKIIHQKMKAAYSLQPLNQRMINLQLRQHKQIPPILVQKLQKDTIHNFPIDNSDTDTTLDQDIEIYHSEKESDNQSDLNDQKNYQENSQSDSQNQHQQNQQKN